MEQRAVAAPAVDHRLRRPARRRRTRSPGTCCDGSKSRRLEHPAVERHAVADVDRKNSAGGCSSARELRRERGVVGERAQRPVAGQRDEVGRRRPVEARDTCGTPSGRPARGRRRACRLRPAGVTRSGAPAPSSRDAIQVALASRCRARRGSTSQPPLLVDAHDVDDVAVEPRDERRRAAVARRRDRRAASRRARSARGTRGRRRSSATSSTTSTHVFDSSRKTRRDVAGARVGEQQVVAVLQPVQLLDRERSPVVDPLHAREVGARADRRASASTSSAPPPASTTPMRTAEFVVPAFGYGIPRDRRDRARRCR